MQNPGSKGSSNFLKVSNPDIALGKRMAPLGRRKFHRVSELEKRFSIALH